MDSGALCERPFASEEGQRVTEVDPAPALRAE